MNPPFSLGAPVPEIIWASLEGVLNGSMRALVKSIATTLKQPEAPLLKALKDKTISPYILTEKVVKESEEEIDARCDYICAVPSYPRYCQPCCRPILWSAGIRRCAEHAYSAKVNYVVPKVQPLKHDGDTLFVGEDDTVYNTACEAVGQMNRETGRLTLFVVAE